MQHDREPKFGWLRRFARPFMSSSNSPSNLTPEQAEQFAVTVGQALTEALMEFNRQYPSPEAEAIDGRDAFQPFVEKTLEFLVRQERVMSPDADEEANMNV